MTEPNFTLVIFIDPFKPTANFPHKKELVKLEKASYSNFCSSPWRHSSCKSSWTRPPPSAPPNSLSPSRRPPRRHSAPRPCAPPLSATSSRPGSPARPSWRPAGPSPASQAPRPRLHSPPLPRPPLQHLLWLKQRYSLITTTKIN